MATWFWAQAVAPRRCWRTGLISEPGTQARCTWKSMEGNPPTYPTNICWGPIRFSLVLSLVTPPRNPISWALLSLSASTGEEDEARRGETNIWSQKEIFLVCPQNGKNWWQEKLREKELWKYRMYRQVQGGGRTSCAGESWDKGLDTSTLNQLQIILRILQKLFLKTVRKKNVLVIANISNYDHWPSRCALWFTWNVYIFSLICSSQPNMEGKWAGKKVQPPFCKFRNQDVEQWNPLAGVTWFRSSTGGWGANRGFALGFEYFYFTMFTHPGKAEQTQGWHSQV